VATLSSEEEVSPEHVAWSHDGRFVAATSFYGDAGVGTLSVWRVRDRKRTYHFDGWGDYFEDISEGPLGFVGKTHMLVCGADWFNVDSRRPRISNVVRTGRGHNLHSVALCGKDNNLILLDRIVDTRIDNRLDDPYTVWDPVRRKPLWSFRSKVKHASTYASLSPDAAFLVAVTETGGDSNPGFILNLFALPDRKHIR